MASLWGGKKDVNENLATLPTVIIGVNEDGSPRMAQWNYKILTHPISFDIPLNRFVIKFMHYFLQCFLH